MTLQFTRLRSALASLSSLHRSLYSPVIHTSPPIPRSFISPSPSVQSLVSLLLQSRTFTGSRVSLASSGKQYKVYKEGDEITEDTVLFEGCDFNHWLITVDFPKDPAPSPQEMVETYERICAQGLNIGIEEAKKKIYACSTSTYNGFQAVMTEEESERFKDVPGVVFVLPDSYIDPQNKQYGGDKYENGLITPRPPPYQYKKAGRFNDRNRGPTQPRYDQRGGPVPNQGGNPQYNQQGYPEGGGNYGAQQSYPPGQNYGAPGQGERMPMNNNNYQANRGAPYQGNYNQGHQGGHYPQDQRANTGGPYQGSYDKGQQGGHYPQDQRPNTGGPYQGSYNQGQHGGHYPQDQRANAGVPYQGSYNQGQQGGHYPQDQRANTGGPYQGSYNQGQQGGYYPHQRDFQQGGRGDFRQDNPNISPGPGGTQGYGANTGYRQGYPTESQNFSQMDQKSMNEENPPYPSPMGQIGTNQAK